MDNIELLKKKVSELGLKKVAEMLGYARSSVSLVLLGKYKGNLDNFLTRVREVFGGDYVNCPVLGTLELFKCSEYQKKAFSNTNPLRIRLWKACQTCKNNKKNKKGGE